MRDLKEFTNEHLIEALDDELEHLAQAMREAVGDLEYLELSRSYANLEKQRRELMID